MVIIRSNWHLGDDDDHDVDDYNDDDVNDDESPKGHNLYKKFILE